MSLFIYIAISAAYIMTIHFAFGIRKYFDLYVMIALFVVGMAVGAVMKSYETGLILSIVLSLIF